jgi:uncharacterized pyridoxal phosphate-containing UPF0001 family protein
MIEIQRVTHVKHYSNSALDRLVDLGARHFGSRRIDVALSRYLNLKSYFRRLLARLRHNCVSQVMPNENRRHQVPSDEIAGKHACRYRERQVR